jgi:hypothetical protein
MLGRAPLAAAGTVAALLCLATPAVAADNVKISDRFSFVDSATCVDQILVEYSYDEQVHTYYADGEPVRLAFTGTVSLRYTDTVTGQTLAPPSSGPGTVDLATGQSFLRGGNGAVFTEAGLLATNGRLILDADGNAITLAHHQTPVCTALGTAPR